MTFTRLSKIVTARNTEFTLNCIVDNYDGGRVKVKEIVAYTDKYGIYYAVLTDDKRITIRVRDVVEEYLEKVIVGEGNDQ